jgi:hypothetical protein
MISPYFYSGNKVRKTSVTGRVWTFALLPGLWAERSRPGVGSPEYTNRDPSLDETPQALNGGFLSDVASTRATASLTRSPQW